MTNKLNEDPVKMYEFVRNNIVYELYCGSRKSGKHFTLAENHSSASGQRPAPSQRELSGRYFIKFPFIPINVLHTI